MWTIVSAADDFGAVGRGARLREERRSGRLADLDEGLTSSPTGEKRTCRVLSIYVHVADVHNLERLPPARFPLFASGGAAMTSSCSSDSEMGVLKRLGRPFRHVDGVGDRVGEGTEAKDGGAKVFRGGARERDRPQVVRENRSLSPDCARADVCVFDSEFGTEPDKEVDKGVVSDAGEGLQGSEEGDAGPARDGGLDVAHKVVYEARIDADCEEEDDGGEQEAGAEGAFRFRDDERGEHAVVADVGGGGRVGRGLPRVRRVVGGMGSDAAYAPRPDWPDLRRREEASALVRVRVLVRVRAGSPGLEWRTG